MYDVNEPTIWPITPGDGKYVAVSQPVINTFITDLVWDGNDATSGVFGSGLDASTVTITLDTTEYTPSTGVEVAADGSVRFVPPSPLQDGAHTLQVSADDLNGNQTTSPLQHFTVDTNDPIVVVTSVTPQPFEPQSTGANTVTISYDLGEDAAVSITVYSGPSVDDTNYRDLIYYDGYDPVSGGQTYSSAGSHDMVYDGLLAVPEPNEGGQGHVLVDYSLDAGTYTFMIRAVDKAGNEGSATGTFEIQYIEGQTINPVFCNFSIDPTIVSDCNVFVVTATFNDDSNQPVPDRLVAIRPASTQNVPPVIEDVFFGGGTDPEIFMLMPTDANGEIRFSIERMVTGSTYISCEISSSDIQLPIGSPASILAIHVCAQNVDANECMVSGPSIARVCSPFNLIVKLCDSANQPIAGKNVGVRVESDRTEPLSDEFFSADRPQDTNAPVFTDANGIALIPVYAKAQGSPTYTVYLNQEGSKVSLGTAQVQVTGTCMISPDTTCSSVQVVPSTVSAGESAEVQVYLMDSDCQPMAYTTFAIILTSDRNDWETEPPVVVDLFGDANIVEPDAYHIVTTDTNGMAAITVESISAGTAEFNVDVLSVYGDVTVGPAYLIVTGTTGDLVDIIQSGFVIDPLHISEVPYATEGTITLRNDTGDILAGKLIGLRIKSDRNYLPDTPYAVDHFFDDNIILPAIVPVVTDAEGCIHVPIETVVAGTAQIMTEISSSTGWLLIGRQTVQFDDADGDDIPDDDDEYPNDDNRRDCDCDGLPDTIDLNDGMDDDGDGIPNFCDQDCSNLNGVNPVNFQDFSILSADWKQTGAGLPGDLDGNGIVDIYDLNKFIQHWLGDCYE
ncbi:MAG: Ig-like domain-containing protein [Planctomycetota bacterium]